MLKWQFIVLALFVSGMLCFATPGHAGMLVSRSGDTGGSELSRPELEREILTTSLEKLGWSQEETEIKLALLSEEEIQYLSSTLEKVMAGGEEEEKSNAIGVAIVIVLVVAGITGLYLFAQN